MAGGGNIYQQSAGAMQGAYGGAQNALSLAQNPSIGNYSPLSLGNPANAASHGYQSAYITGPAQMGVAQYGAQNMGPAAQTGWQGYTGAMLGPAAQASSYGYNAAQQAGPQAISSAMGAYRNPYEQQVVNAAGQDIMRQNRMMLGDVGASAASAGAFGGSRHGLVEAETNRAALEQMAQTTGQLRHQGFTTAAGLGAQDVGNRMAVAGANQNATNTARQFGAAAQNAVSQYNAGNRFAAQQANQASANAARQFGANAANTAGQFNAAQRFAGQQANQAAQNTARQYNATARNSAMQYNAGNRFAAQQSNMDAQNAARQYNASNRQQASMFNAGNDFQAQQLNQSAQNAARAYNASNQDRNFEQQLAASGLLASLGQQGFGMGQAIDSNLAQQGGLVQGLNQALLGGQNSMFNEYINTPQKLLELRLGALGVNPLNRAGTQTSSNTPGLMDWLSTGGQLAGIAKGKP